MAQVIEAGKAIRLESEDHLERRKEWRPWKARGYRVPTQDGKTIWHEREAIRRLVLEAFREIDADLFLFGSQAAGTSGKRSDYDVGFFPAAEVAPARLAALVEELEALPIPNVVEVVDFRAVREGFLAAVLDRREGVEVWKTRQENSLFT